MSDSVLLEVSNGVALVTLNRPDARNALNVEMVGALSTTLASVEGSDDITVAILTGAGSAFCAGLDLKEMAASGANLVPSRGRPWPQMTKPLIGAVNGAAVTGGLELALACDFLIASEAARFADTHTQVGLVPFWGLSVLLPQAVGLRMARSMSLTGRFLSAADALRCGLVTRVVEPDQLISVAMSIAADIALADQRATREILSQYAGYSGGGADALARESQLAESFLGEHLDLTLIEERSIALLARAKGSGQLGNPSKGSALD
jgi:enoyl-CoA hydratase